MKILAELMSTEPENALLLPLESEMPTVTSVRIKSIMTGSLSTFFETKEDFQHDHIDIDNLLYQVKHFDPRREEKQAKKSKRMKQADVEAALDSEASKLRKVLFTGDHIWLDMFGAHFD